MTAVRVHRYTVAADRLDDLLDRRAQAITGIRAGFPGLTGTRLIGLEDGSYVDTWTWESAEQMNAALQASSGNPGVAAILALTGDHVVASGEIIADI
ncbi:hypothetical protein Afil01_32900 [Actinorhabdospora filicis]|uniref:ABM domain-containing protein n=1 Tax=Actinorhabdospora filicis TaxID=1785913 RepID=A0A9W6SLK4_9ACTN|nr:hypothetical protein [Actinorhabdospora filicis]GLZ78483.1 hypothetical protein Afil01_32900 [Actinorhabdospora filicis]